MLRIAVSRSRGADAADYLARLQKAGLEPAELVEPDVSLYGFAGLLITGGRDLDPARYGEPPGPATQAPNQERDTLDFSLLQAALRAGLPVLGICRGLQVINVCLGGSLVQHVEGHAAEAEPPNASRWHEVTLEPECVVAGALGATRVLVNSRHHQAVTRERLAHGLRCVALSAEGYVEAIESDSHPWLVAVQWHPERAEAETPGFAADSARLFAAFAAAARAREAAARPRWVTRDRR